MLQGDIVKYEEDFVGIEYTGTWTTIEDENCSGGKAKYSNTKRDYLSFNFLGSSWDYSTIATEDTGYCMIEEREKETNTLRALRTVKWNS